MRAQSYASSDWAVSSGLDATATARVGLGICPTRNSPAVLACCGVLQGLPANLAGNFGGMQMAAGMPNQQLMAAGALQQQQAGVYDPIAMDVSKLNAMFMQRQQPALAGAFMRPVG